MAKVGGTPLQLNHTLSLPFPSANNTSPHIAMLVTTIVPPANSHIQHRRCNSWKKQQLC